MATHAELVAELVQVLRTDGTSEARAGAATGLGAAGGGAQALAALRYAMMSDGTALVRGAAAAAVGVIIGRGNPQDFMSL